MSEAITATLPVFSRYLGQIRRILDKLPPEMLAVRLADDGFSAAEHFAIAQGYVLRSLWPVLGREVPKLEEADDPTALIQRGDWIADQIAALTLADFDGCETRIIRHRAGHAELEQPAQTYVLSYGLPNFFFHLGQAYAALRSAGVPIGKSDFDGYHHYPAGFSFVSAGTATAE